MTVSIACCVATTVPQRRGYADCRVGKLRSHASSKHLVHVRWSQLTNSALQHRANPNRTSHRCRARSTSMAQSTARGTRLPPTVNWHLEPRCNYGCKFCFATFEDVKQHLQSKALQGSSGTADQLMQVPQLLKAAGANKINFVGGEPFLHPLIYQLIEAAKCAGLVTSVVTNGSCLDAGKLLRLQMARELGFRLKLNTVVSRINLYDDMAPLVLQMNPERWKVFQVLPMEGQNDGRVEPLLIREEEFDAWVARHQPLVAAAGIRLVPETNDAMMGSYAMLDADCRFYTNAAGRHEYGPSIFEVAGGVLEAWSSVAGPAFSASAYLDRGGVYDWGQGQEAMQAAMLQMGGASKALTR